MGTDLRLLDVGTGNGQMLSRLVTPGLRVVGTDLSDRLLRQGQQHLARSGLGHVPLVACDARALSFGSHIFHAVTLIEVIEHIPTPSVGIALKECRRVLRPDGRLLVVTPNLKNLQRRLGLRWLRRRERYPHFPCAAMPGDTQVHYTEYEAQELRGLLEHHGFRVESLLGDLVGLGLVGAAREAVVYVGSELLARLLPALSNHLVVIARRV